MGFGAALAPVVAAIHDVVVVEVVLHASLARGTHDTPRTVSYIVVAAVYSQLRRQRNCSTEPEECVEGIKGDREYRVDSEGILEGRGY